MMELIIEEDVGSEDIQDASLLDTTEKEGLISHDTPGA